MHLTKPVAQNVYAPASPSTCLRRFAAVSTTSS
jgi:hypothetical protein